MSHVWVTDVCSVLRDSPPSSPPFPSDTRPSSPAAASPRWTAASPRGPGTWATPTGASWPTRRRTRSPAPAPRPPRPPALPQRKRGSSSQQVSCPRVLVTHTGYTRTHTPTICLVTFKQSRLGLWKSWRGTHIFTTYLWLSSDWIGLVCLYTGIFYIYIHVMSTLCFQ